MTKILLTRVFELLALVFCGIAFLLGASNNNEGMMFASILLAVLCVYLEILDLKERLK